MKQILQFFLEGESPTLISFLLLSLGILENWYLRPRTPRRDVGPGSWPLELGLYSIIYLLESFDAAINL